MEDRELCAIIEAEVSSAVGYPSGELSQDRATLLDYYNSAPFGNEIEGESQVVSSDVFDAVESALPSLLRIFTASDDVVMFEPNGPEDEEQAKQMTEVANYVFFRQNNGFLILYEWFKDALIQRNGVVKYYWEEKYKTTEESYEGLSEAEYQKLVNDEDVELIEHTEREDDALVDQKNNGLIELLARLDQQNIPPEQKAKIKAELQQKADAIQIPNLHDVKLKVTRDQSKCCIEVVPPEEFGISQKQKCISIQETPFCYQRRRMTVSELREMGCPENIIEEIGGGEHDARETGPEALARDRLIDQQWNLGDHIDESTKDVWVTDCFIRMDYDGDGIAELRHIIKPGNAIWINEEADHINFAAITPIIMPHRWVGKSLADLVASDQFTKSVLWRQMLQNLYLTNNPRKAVLSSASGVVQANLDDLMDSRAGGIMREYVQGAIRNEETPFVAGAAFPMLEYIDSQKEVRTGQSRYNQGTDADSLNKTARGIQMIQQAGQQRGDMIARIFAETGVKDLMRGIVYMLSTYSSKEMTIKLRNKWVDIDPREWKEQFNMVVNVGLGTGNKDVQLAHLQAMHQSQLELMQSGKGYLVTDQNLYNVHKLRAEAMGFKHPEIFVSDPTSVQPPPPQPNPDLIKIQADAQIEKEKIDSNQTIRMFDAQTQKELAAITAQASMNVAQINAESQRQIAEMKARHEAQIELFRSNQGNGDGLKAQIEDMRAQNDMQKESGKILSQERIAEMQAQLDKYKAELDANTRLEIARMSKEAKPPDQSVGREFDNLKKTNDDLLKTISSITESMKKQGKKKISITLPSGQVANAEVTQD